MTWMHKTRLRALAFVLGVALAAFGVISLASVPAWPVVGVAVAALAVGLNKMTARMVHPICWGCGGDLKGQAAGQYGVACPKCGSVNQAGVRLLGPRRG
jgi:predicted RNA-binding Zn-ribbon protein involved in translation (DUF1610 family)